MAAPSGILFGRVLTAMITPFTADGAVDYSGAQRLAAHLVDCGNDGLVINGTTGEAPTTTDDEKQRLLQAVLEAVGDRATIIAGAGTNDTAHTIELARAAEKTGAAALLVVTPYYNRPPQAGLVRHFTAVADAVGVPLILYDIPARSGVPIEPDTLLRLAEHPRIAAVKDAKGDLEAAVDVMRRSDLSWYSGDDGLNLPFLSIGATGFISVTGHVVADRLQQLVAAYLCGDFAEAAAINSDLQPVATGLFRTQGAILVKAALAHLGLPAGPLRSPLIDATAEQRAQLVRDLHAGGVPGFGA